MKAEFRILNGRFINVKTGCEKKKEFCSPPPRPKVDSDSGDDSASDENETGGGNYGKSDGNLCPQLLALVATTRKLLVVNMRSGEVELSVKYEGFFPSLKICAKI